MRLIKTSSTEETLQVARELAKELPFDATLLFYGDMASGKTTFIKGVASAFEIDEAQVTSPTFVYLNIYYGKVIFYHFDLWRLKSKEEFLSLGFEEFLFAPGIKCFEWSERLEGLLVQDKFFDKAIKITFSSSAVDQREILVEGI